MRVLAISAHQDDETLGCGGTLLSHRLAGDELFWLILTKAHAPRWNQDFIQREEEDVQRVAEAFGMAECFRPGLPATHLDFLPLNEIITPVRETIEKIHPETIYTVFPGDIHTDHQAVFEATSIVLKTFAMKPLGVRRLLCFECLSSTDAAPQMLGRVFAPNVFRDIGQHLERKIEIMNLYSTQMQQGSMPRTESAIRALARLRGASIGVEYAEAFMLVREVVF